MSRLVPCSCTAAAGLCVAMSALAQSAPDTPPAQSELEEVIVTAQKRSENLQTAPLAATAISGQDIDERGIEQIADLQYSVPGLSVSNTGTSSIVNIRGIGLALVGPTTSSGITNYRDGVLITHEPFLLDAYFDQQRIEVLRGPQGTLSGSNSTGGSIFVVSRDPSLDGHVNGYVEQALGSYHDVRTQGALNLPISSSWAARIAFNTESRDSYYNQVGAPGSATVSSSNAPGALSQQAVRLSLLGKPTQELTILLKSEYNDNRGDGIPNTPTPFSAYYAYASHVPFTLSYDRTDTLNKTVDWRNILTIDWQFSTAAQLRWQSAWTWGRDRHTDDVDASTYSGQLTSFDNGFRTFQQELDLISSGAGPLQYTLGAFFYDDQVREGLHIFQFGLPGGVPLIPYEVQPFGISKAMDYAIYAQTTYDLTSEWQLLTGARYTRNRRWDTGSAYITPLSFLPEIVLPLAPVYDKGVGTGKVGVNWKPNAHNLVYAFVARGAKSGGFNTDGPSFDPETLWDYELGWKPTLVDGHVRAQLDGYYMNYRNVQLNSYDPTTQSTGVASAGNARIYGLEAQLQMRAGGLGVNATGAYVHSGLGNQIFYDTRYTPALPFNVDGHVLPYAPKWTTALELEYAFAVRGGTLTPRAHLSYVSSQSTQIFQVAQGPYSPARDLMRSRTLLDASLTWQLGGAWLAELYGRNLANRLYVQAMNSTATTDNVIYGDPRTFGVRASYSF